MNKLELYILFSCALVYTTIFFAGMPIGEQHEFADFLKTVRGRFNKTDINCKLPPYPSSKPCTKFECPKNISRGEFYAKQCIENIFTSHKFEKIRPSWLKNPDTSKNLELDLYNDELKIALEYNGRQHYHYTKFFHTCQGDFEKQKKRDQHKYQTCCLNGVYLITIPYTVNLNCMQRYIYEKLKFYPEFM